MRRARSSTHLFRDEKLWSFGMKGQHRLFRHGSGGRDRTGTMRAGLTVFHNEISHLDSSAARIKKEAEMVEVAKKERQAPMNSQLDD